MDADIAMPRTKRERHRLGGPEHMLACTCVSGVHLYARIYACMPLLYACMHTCNDIAACKCTCVSVGVVQTQKCAQCPTRRPALADITGRGDWAYSSGGRVPNRLARLRACWRLRLHERVGRLAGEQAGTGLEWRARTQLYARGCFLELLSGPAFVRRSATRHTHPSMPRRATPRDLSRAVHVQTSGAGCFGSDRGPCAVATHSRPARLVDESEHVMSGTKRRDGVGGMKSGAISPEGKGEHPDPTRGCSAHYVGI